MAAKLKFGILSTAKIGLEKVIPGLQGCQQAEVVAIASRDKDNAARAAASLDIPTAHGSYEALLADPGVDAIYNPLPNHLHVPWTIKALQAGKHVLCEKPIGLSVADAETLIAASAEFPELRVMEAFMYRFHPQWIQARDWVNAGAIGEVRTLQTFFSYFNDDPDNIRNKAEIGGGGLMDIGCYPISQARFILDREPARVMALLDIDTRFDTDRSATAIMDFGAATAAFTCSTQMSPYQRTHIVGDTGRIEIEIPVNAPPLEPCYLSLITADETRRVELEPVDQYMAQGDAFARAVLENTDVPTPLTDSLANMQVIEAMVKSHRQNGWTVL